MKKHKVIKKIIIYGIALGYLFLPFDIIPDIPIIGLIDDAIILTLSYFIAEKKNKTKQKLWMSQNT